MNAAQFAQQIQLLTDRATQLSQRASQATAEESALLLETFEELRTALEELFVAQEELLTQHQELAIAGNQVEAERQRYQDLFEFAPDGYFVTDTNGLIRAANRAAAQLLNVSVQYLIGKPLSNFIPSEDRSTFRTTLNQLKERTWLLERELRIAPRHAEVFEAAMTVSTLQPTEEGKAIEWRWLLRDIRDRVAAEAATLRAHTAEVANTTLQREIKERQQLEAALRESEERYRVFSELTSDYTYAYRIELDGSFVLERLSEAFTRICGYTVEDVASQGWQSLIPYKDRAIVLRQVQQLLAGEAEPCEHRLLTKYGEVRWVCHYARPVWESVPDYPFRIFHIYGAAKDITERKCLELERSQLLESERFARIEAQAANRLKDNFLAIVSHELRSPLNAILGWTQLLAKGNFDASETSKALKIIERNALLQNKLIEDLLDISRIVRGKIHLHLVQTNLIPAIEAAIAAVQFLAEAKKIEIESILNHEASCILGDPERLQQIIWNLLTNAIKFTPVGGQVKVQLARVGDRIEITITDTGIGIKPDVLPYIFESFHQADITSPQSRGGLGLGLAIVRQLVGLHHGTVCAASQGEAKGSTFSVRFPACNDCPPKPGSLPINTTTEPETSVPNYSRLNNLQVLVVDDEADTRMLLAVILEQNGAKVTAVASVREALQILEQAQPDVLLSDIGMPDEDGYSLLRQVRALEVHRGGFLPAAAITAFTRDKDCQQSLLSGFQAHLAKPIQFAELINLVAKLARQAQKIDD